MSFIQRATTCQRLLTVCSLTLLLSACANQQHSDDSQSGSDEIANSLISGELQFTSAAAPVEVYRVHLFKGDLPAEGELYRQATAQYFKLFEERYETTLEPITLQDHEVSGVTATSATFGQHIPQRSALGLNAEAVDIWHSYYYLERGDNAAFIWINRPQPNQPGATQGAEERIEGFIDSFQLTSKSLH